MKLSRVSNAFNNLTVNDAYNPAVTFKVQHDPLSYSKVDGVAIRKRSISAAPDIVMPSRGVITIDGTNYLIGHPAPDYWMGACIRKNYVIQAADGLANLLTIQQALANAAPTQAYASAVFTKYETDERESSDYFPQYQIFFAESESLPADSLVQLNGAWYLVKESYDSQAGLRVALANEIGTSVFETVSFGSKTYDPLTDSYTSTGTSVKILRVRWSEHFNYMGKAAAEYERGDQQVFVLKSAMSTAKASDTLTLSDGTWRIVSVQDEGQVLSLHCRRD